MLVAELEAPSRASSLSRVGPYGVHLYPVWLSEGKVWTRMKRETKSEPQRMRALEEGDLLVACERCGTIVVSRLRDRHERYHQRWENAERLARRAMEALRSRGRR